MSPWGTFDNRISNLGSKAKIWRYLDLPKFLDMFVKRRIYFRRADQLLDAFEGMPTFPLRDYIYARYKKVEDETGAFDGDPIASADNAFIRLRKCNFINCWYLSDYESAAMWSLYSQIGSGIAVQSTGQRLRDALPTEAYIGKVMYVDHSVADVERHHDLRSVLFLKRNHFEYEKEVRVVLSVSPENSDIDQIGHYVNDVDLGELVESVILAPNTPPWLHEGVKVFMQMIGFGSAIGPSELDRTYLEAAESSAKRKSKTSST
jgi:hypothetical protein